MDNKTIAIIAVIVVIIAGVGVLCLLSRQWS